MATDQSQSLSDFLDVRDERIRDAAKWLVGSFAAVGAALIAGSQLSSIGKLPLCLPDSVACSRLWISMLGALLALLGVVFAVWTGVNLLAPDRLQVSDLQKQWKPGFPVYDYLHANRSQMQGFSSITEMDRDEQEAYARFKQLKEEYEAADERRQGELTPEIDEARGSLTRILARSDAVMAIANHVNYTYGFKRKALPRLMLSAAFAALGIVAFAWAANPPAPTTTVSLRGSDLHEADLSGANLRNVDLTDANLTDANLSAADLSGAVLTGATLGGVTWDGTTCPDGIVVREGSPGCENHRTP